MKAWWRVLLHTLFPFLDHDRRTWRVEMEGQQRAAERAVLNLSRVESPLVRDVFAPNRRRKA